MAQGGGGFLYLGLVIGGEKCLDGLDSHRAWLLLRRWPGFRGVYLHHI